MSSVAGHSHWPGLFQNLRTLRHCLVSHPTSVLLAKKLYKNNHDAKYSWLSTLVIGLDRLVQPMYSVCWPIYSQRQQEHQEASWKRDWRVQTVPWNSMKTVFHLATHSCSRDAESQSSLPSCTRGFQSAIVNARTVRKSAPLRFSSWSSRSSCWTRRLLSQS